MIFSSSVAKMEARMYSYVISPFARITSAVFQFSKKALNLIFKKFIFVTKANFLI